MSNFSFDEIKNFDTHIDMSIPNYNQLKEIILDMSSYFIKGANVYDLGCSTGMLLDELSKRYSANYIGYDISENLLGKNCENKKVIFFLKDIFLDLEVSDADIVYSIFTLQFIQKYKRLPILKNVYKGLKDGGALIITEKISLDSGYIQDIFQFTYYDYKSRHFTYNDIFEKQKDLRVIMLPISENENIELLRNAGFSKIHSFWQSLLFKGWICIK
jgi:tRNA (cmo5U34)-methyltransferase